jgi:hypothetical protein
MHVNSFDILELQDWRSFNLDITKKCTYVNLVYYAYSERFVRQSFLYGKLHVICITFGVMWSLDILQS